MRYSNRLNGLSWAGSVVVSVLSLPVGAEPPLFGPMFQRPDIEFSGTVTGLSCADVDLDGDLDVVCAMFVNVAVLRNAGHGVLASPVIVTEDHPDWETCAVACVDLNADGWPDIAAVNDDVDTVSVYFNLGGASFASGINYDVGDAPRSIVVVDADADGDLDLVVLNTLSDDISTLLNDGHGAFAPELRTGVPWDVAEKGHLELFPYPGPTMDSGDLDGDGNPDLAIPLTSGVGVLLGDGKGAFHPGPDQPGMGGYDVVAADLNGDGAPDLAAIDDQTNKTVKVALNNGDATWTAPTAYSGDFLQCVTCHYFYTSLCAGDADGDGDLDLLFGSEVREGVGLLRNDGEGGFGEPEWVPGPRECWVVEFADVTGDGADDLVIGSDYIRPGLRVYPAGEDALIGPELVSTFETIGKDGHHAIACGDLDLDGHVDIVGVDHKHDVIEILAGNGDGTFWFPEPIPVTHEDPIALEHVAIGDLNGDGLLDIVAADAGENGGFSLPGRVWVALSEGGMTFGTPVATGMGDRYPMDVACADMDGDGDLDVVAWSTDPYPGNDVIPIDQWILIFSNDGMGELALTQEVVLATFPLAGAQRSALALADFDGDGDNDVVATDGAYLGVGFVYILLNDGHAILTRGQQVQVAPNPDALVCADLDGDGDADLGVMHNHYGNADLTQAYLTVLHNDGRGEFVVADEHFDVGVTGRDSIGAADLDGDGFLDVVTPDQMANVAVHLNRGDGTFEQTAKHATVDEVTGLALADFNEDGQIDIVGANFSINSVTFLPNLGPAACGADFNGDGALNILDFVAFAQAFTAGELSADCDGDGVLVNPLDFVCFQRAFLAGCE